MLFHFVLFVLGMGTEKVLSKNDKYKETTDKPVDFVIDKITSLKGNVAKMKENNALAKTTREFMEDNPETNAFYKDLDKNQKYLYGVSLGKILDENKDKTNDERVEIVINHMDDIAKKVENVKKLQEATAEIEGLSPALA